jgi:predicted RNA-binding protein with TRAM domain
MSYRNRSRYAGGGGSYGRSGGYGGFTMNQGPKPVEVGKEYDVEITELSRRGDGVAKISGFVVFVKGAKMGEKVKIKIETIGPRFATASALGPASGKAETSDSSQSSTTTVTEPVQ